MSNSELVDLQLIQSLVPVNALTSDHVRTLLRNQSIESLYKGQILFDNGEYDNSTVYLLSGSICLIDSADSSEETCVFVAAEDNDCRFPIGHYQPRRSRAVAATDCTIIRFNSDQLDSMLAWDQAAQYILLDISSQRHLDEDADWMITLLKSNLFYKIPPMNIGQILHKFEPHYVGSGEIIIRQGEIGDCCYFIKEGSVGVYKAENDRSCLRLVAQLGVGRCFGEDALVNDVERNATIVMHGNGVLMKLEKQDFYLLLKQVRVHSVSLDEAKKQVAVGAQWIDVRTQDEFDRGHCDTAIHMPLNLLKLKSRLLDKNKHYIIYCNSGRRSEVATLFLTEGGFNASFLQGGFVNYSPFEQDVFELQQQQSCTPVSVGNC